MCVCGGGGPGVRQRARTLTPPLTYPTQPQLDWPALVRALVQALDDIGCRPRQFSAAQARAIRAAQKARGLTAALWEGWEALAEEKSAAPHNPLGGIAGDALASLMKKLGVAAEDVAAGVEAASEELWPDTAEDVFEWGPAHPGADPAEQLPQLPGVPLKGARLEDIHLVPVTGGGPEDGARLPYVNVRARCVPESRTLHDKGPWS